MLEKFSGSQPLATAAVLILASEFFLVLSGLSIRQVSNTLHTAEVVFFRNLLGLLLLLPWFAHHRFNGIRTGVLRFHFMRAAVGVTAMSCLYYSWASLPMAQAALFKQTAPFFTPLIALWWLGERVTPLLKWSLLVGFLGVFVVLNPQQGMINMAAIIALVGAALGGVTKVTVRRLAKTEGPQRIVFYFSLFSALLSAVPAALHWVQPGFEEMLWLGLLATTSTLAQLFLSKGYALAPAGQLGPFTYTSIAFAALIGWWFWDETMDWNTLLGILLIVLAGLLAMQPARRPKKSLTNE